MRLRTSTSKSFEGEGPNTPFYNPLQEVHTLIRFLKKKKEVNT
ncbi:unnamed protein product [Musa textilis]